MMELKKLIRQSARGFKNKINNYAKIQNLVPNLIVLPMVFDTYRNMDVKSKEFCTVLFGRLILMSRADRRYPFKLANFRQRLSLVVARAVARQALSYMQSGACVAYDVSTDDLFIHEPFWRMCKCIVRVMVKVRLRVRVRASRSEWGCLLLINLFELIFFIENRLPFPIWIIC